MLQAEIGVFGGSGFYEFLTDVKEIWVETPYGAPSDKIALAMMAGKRVAFLPRHGKDHRYPPGQINYRANVWAMHSLGVHSIIGPCAAGSLTPEVKPGQFVICDQFVNRTWGREDTFFTGPITKHVSPADPYCPRLRNLAVEAADAQGITVHPRGTVVVVQGPRFSTRAESKEFQSHGWEVINMTQYPEAYLCRELGMCYVNISLITDYDAGLEGEPSIAPVSHQAVLRVFQENIDNLKHVLHRVISRIDDDATCACRNEEM